MAQVNYQLKENQPPIALFGSKVFVGLVRLSLQGLGETPTFHVFCEVQDDNISV
jgi:hypothetical protein